MKRIIALILTALLLLTACGQPAEPQVEEPARITEFSVGYCRKIMNPTHSIPLAGYGNVETRYLKEIGHDITASVLAFSDGEGTDILVINTDFCTVGTALGEMIQTAVNTSTGVPVDRIYVSGNHSHSAPSIDSSTAEDYKQACIRDIADAAVEAMADRKPASMYTGEVETENLNFIKHYEYIDENGEKQFFGDNFGTAVYNETTKHATEVDPTMHLLKISREGCKDIVVANWRAHPHFTGGSAKYVLSADYPGAFREALEAQVDCNAVFLQGACGNVNSSTRLEKERRTTDVRTFGNLLAGYAIEGLENMTEIETGTIRTKYFEYYGDINHTFDSIYTQAKVVTAVWSQTNSWAECRPYMDPYGIRSPYHANAIAANYSRTKEKDGLLRLNAVAIGDEFAFVTFPGELFDAISVGVEEGSPFNKTMLIGYSTGHIGYLPSGYAYEYTSYETDITRFVAGTGEIVRDEYLRVLNELKEA